MSDAATGKEGGERKEGRGSGGNLLGKTSESNKKNEKQAIKGENPETKKEKRNSRGNCLEVEKRVRGPLIDLLLGGGPCKA